MVALAQKFALLVIVGSFVTVMPSAAAEPVCVGEGPVVCANADGTSACITQNGNSIACAWAGSHNPGACVYQQGEDLVCSEGLTEDLLGEAEPVIQEVNGVVGIVLDLAGVVLDLVFGAPQLVGEIYPDEGVCTPDDETLACIFWGNQAPYVFVCIDSLGCAP